ncbi:MAG: NADH-quinone oxidoreductase subunit A [Dehalococcoidales bacterium]
MLENYAYIALFLLIALGFTSFLLLLPVILRLLRVVPRKPSPVKAAAFECGMETIGKTWVQFNFRYYFYALILIALDVMVVFLYPWAVELRQLGVSGLAVVLVFIFIIVVGYVYAWRKGVLEWK